MGQRQDRSEKIAQALGYAGGGGALLVAAQFQLLGGGDLNAWLHGGPALDGAPLGLAAEAQASQLAANLALGLIGCGLLWAASRRRGWLYSLGRFAALWIGAFAAARIFYAAAWGDDLIAPQTLLLILLAALAGGAAAFAAPRRQGV